MMQYRMSNPDLENELHAPDDEGGDEESALRTVIKIGTNSQSIEHHHHHIHHRLHLKIIPFSKITQL